MLDPQTAEFSRRKESL